MEPTPKKTENITPEQVVAAPEVLNPEVPRGLEKPDVIVESAPPEIALEELTNLPPEKISEVYIPSGVAAQKDFATKEIEKVMEKDLEEVFAEMPSDLQIKFKTKGEEAAQKIRGMLTRAKEMARNILELIKSWLGLIPGVSKYFLEQEAKIKTDEILKIAEEQGEPSKQ
jgi:hypothetical protein